MASAAHGQDRLNTVVDLGSAPREPIELPLSTTNSGTLLTGSEPPSSSKVRKARRPAAQHGRLHATTVAAAAHTSSNPTDGPATHHGIVPFPSRRLDRCKHFKFAHGRVRALKDYSVLQATTDSVVQNKRTGLVHLICRGQWGNRIGEYVFSRLLADELGFGLRIEGGLLDENWKKGHLFPGMAEIPYNVRANAALPKEAFTSHSINLSVVVADRTPRTIKVAGFPFDDIDAFWQHRKTIREDYLAVDIACLFWNITEWPQPTDVVIHLRAYDGFCDAVVHDAVGEFDPHRTFVNPPFDYYDRILNRMKQRGSMGTVWLAARCREADPVARALVKKHGARYVPLTAMHQDVTEWLWLVAASRLVLAQSTFSWWAAFLSNASEIHFPLAGEWWGRNARFRLYPNDSRYIYHDM